MIVFAYMFSNLSSALFANLGLHVFTYTFGLGSGRIAVIIGVQFLFAVVSQPFWAAESRRLGKRAALNTGFILSILGSVYFIALVLAYPLVRGNVLFFIPFAVSVGSGIGALFTLPLSMTADVIDLDEAEGGARIEGVHFGVLTFGYKLSQAFALLVIGFLIDAAGFDPSTPGQHPSTVLILGLVLGVGGFLSFTAAILQLKNYGVTEATVAECRARIAAFQAAGRSAKTPPPA
jgi:Na+/melibiose symporter-like transporter